MSIAFDAVGLSGALDRGLSPADDFDPDAHFDQWLDDLQSARQDSNTAAPQANAEDETSSFHIEDCGSEGELSFSGVLHLDGCSTGNLSSPEGTLVLARHGIVEADISVAVAIINGWVTGDIRATERVLLGSEARVTGQIYTPSLSMKFGAVFSGACLFAESPEFEEPRAEKQPEDFGHFAMGAAA